MNTVDHKYCNLRSKANEDLAKMCAEAVENKDWSSAWHAALHHQMLCHPVMGPAQLDFFNAEVPNVAKLYTDSATDLAKTRSAHVDAAIDSIPSHAPPEIVRILESTMSRFGELNMTAVALMGFWTGTSMTAYVMNKGQGCLFALIDDSLCKESMA